MKRFLLSILTLFVVCGAYPQTHNEQIVIDYIGLLNELCRNNNSDIFATRDKLMLIYKPTDPKTGKQMECRIDDELARYIANQKQMGSIAARPDPFMDYFSITQRNKGYKFEILKIEPDGDEKVHAKIKLTGNGFGKNFDEAGSMVIYDVFRIRGNGIVQIFPDYDAKAEAMERNPDISLLEVRVKECVDSLTVCIAAILCDSISSDSKQLYRRSIVRLFGGGGQVIFSHPVAVPDPDHHTMRSRAQMSIPVFCDYLVANSVSTVNYITEGYDFDLSSLKKISNDIYIGNVVYNVIFELTQGYEGYSNSTYVGDYTIKTVCAKYDDEILIYMYGDKISVTLSTLKINNEK